MLSLRAVTRMKVLLVVINTPLPAITDALSHAAGKRFYELPITPDQIAMASVKDN